MCVHTTVCFFFICLLLPSPFLLFIQFPIPLSLLVILFFLVHLTGYSFYINNGYYISVHGLSCHSFSFLSSSPPFFELFSYCMGFVSFSLYIHLLSFSLFCIFPHSKERYHMIFKLVCLVYVTRGCVFQV